MIASDFFYIYDMSCYKASYSGSDLEFNINNVDYLVDVEASGSLIYAPGRMYMPNGDPGYPDESELTIEDIDSTWRKIINEDEEPIDVEPDSDMLSILEEYLYEQDDWDYEEYERDYDD